MQNMYLSDGTRLQRNIVKRIFLLLKFSFAKAKAAIGHVISCAITVRSDVIMLFMKNRPKGAISIASG